MSIAMRVAIILTALLSVHCDRAKDIAGSAPTPVQPQQPAPQVCPVPQIVWSLSRNLATPQVTITPNVIVDKIEVSAAAGDWVATAKIRQPLELPRFGWYWVRGQNLCGAWSQPEAFLVSPNPVGREELPPPPQPCDIDSRTGKCQ